MITPTSMTAREIRQSFFDFFASKGHTIVPSSPVVLPSDPTLLFTNAGMNQFKEIFLGARKAEATRIADTQKCIRVSGKHNDLEEVGRDTYHHTFFEMLGNWSFGDYYKKEAISWAWELMTHVWKLPKDRLWATVYRTDDEAEELWKTCTDIPHEHILRFDEKDNFWEMGETGPCGPCSEIHIDLTQDGCTPDMVNADRPDVIELWNLVFIQNNRRSDGTLDELPAKHVDTGMGLERIVAVLQGKVSNYDSDIFQPLISKVAEMSGKKYEGEDAVAMRVIADHIRTLSFAIADGVVPSNEGRGYVLRRLLRRAARYGRNIGLIRPFMTELFPTLGKSMGDVFQELETHKDLICRTLQSEEESFSSTLDRGIDLFDEVSENLVAAGESVFPGEDAFRLYDTYGFPVDLTELMASEKGLKLDRAGFEAKMEEQKARARGAQNSDAIKQDSDVIASLVSEGLKSAFCGYNQMDGETDVLAVLAGAERCREVKKGQKAALLLKETPFYAESGGQVGDHGIIHSDTGVFEVTNTRKPAEGILLHEGVVAEGVLRVGDHVQCSVTSGRRSAAMRHHTATHLLNLALRDHVHASIKQAGSYVGPDRLRFDFNYFEALTPEQLVRVERAVNEMIWANHQVSTYSMALKDVQDSGIVAVFDEKYGETVRVVDVNGISRELCGGTHVSATGEIGLFRIVSESSVAAGIRRIEAVCAEPAYLWTRTEHEIVQTLTQGFSCTQEELHGRIDALVNENKKLQKELREQAAAKALTSVDDIANARQDVGGVSVYASFIAGLNMDQLRKAMDALRQKIDSGVVVLGGDGDDKASFVAYVSDDLIERGLHAGNVIRKVAQKADGGGGGQPHKAQAGGKSPEKAPAAIEAVPAIVAEFLKK